MTATVTAKGQITLPVEVRRRLGLKPGSKLEFVVIDDERLEAIPVSETVTSLKGMVPKPLRPLSLGGYGKGHRQRGFVMIGLDTNVLVRYIVRDDEKQSAAATRLIEAKCTTDNPGRVSSIVLCELAWVLTRATDTAGPWSAA